MSLAEVFLLKGRAAAFQPIDGLLRGAGRHLTLAITRFAKQSPGHGNELGV